MLFFGNFLISASYDNYFVLIYDSFNLVLEKT